jgi:glutathione S-transferase
LTANINVNAARGARIGVRAALTRSPGTRRPQTAATLNARSGPARRRLAVGAQALELLETHLRERDWLVGDRPTIADIAIFGYAHVAHEAGLEPGPAVEAWFGRLRALPGFVADLEPYGENARAGAGRSIYG